MLTPPRLLTRLATQIMTRPGVLARRWWLGMRLRAAEFDALILDAEMKAGPARLRSTKHHIQRLRQQLQALPD